MMGRNMTAAHATVPHESKVIKIDQLLSGQQRIDQTTQNNSANSLPTGGPSNPISERGMAQRNSMFTKRHNTRDLSGRDQPQQKPHQQLFRKDPFF